MTMPSVVPRDTADGAGGTACSSDVFVALQRSGKLPQSVFVAPTPAAGDWAYVDALVEHAKAGGKVLLYGPLDHAPAALLDALRVELAAPLDGDFDLDVRLVLDDFVEGYD